ncbi:MAG: DUF2889 domain-containing protein [Novosphingobium sp.]
MTIDHLPGFRRHFRVRPGPDRVVAALEDDIHRMMVALVHDGETITSVEVMQERVPWNMCPGSMERLQNDFVGLPISGVGRRLDKKANCTHLFDLAGLALRHAFDEGEAYYEILVSDPVDGANSAVLRRNGEDRLLWQIADDVIILPEAAAGLALIGLRPWIESLGPEDRHLARMLQWAALVSHGRHMPWETDANMRALPGSCFASQPGRHEKCQRTGERIDFSKPDARPPLAGMGFGV